MPLPCGVPGGGQHVGKYIPPVHGQPLEFRQDEAPGDDLDAFNTSESLPERGPLCCRMSSRESSLLVFGFSKEGPDALGTGARLGIFPLYTLESGEE